jgi:hypothetical protein
MAKRRKTVKKKLKKKVVKKASKSETIHVKLDSPITKRKAILSTAISIVELLKHFETIKGIRKQKAKEMESLRVITKDINKLYRAIKVKDLPLKNKDLLEVHDVSGKPIMSVPAKNIQPKVITPRRVRNVPKPEPVSRDPLERQLNELRRKLDTL